MTRGKWAAVVAAGLAAGCGSDPGTNTSPAEATPELIKQSEAQIKKATEEEQAVDKQGSRGLDAEQMRVNQEEREHAREMRQPPKR